jgi:signal transduction histidine kinase
MRMFSSALRSSRTWWRVVALLIAVPAVGLSWLGLRAVGTDALERERQIRDRQTRLAGLADAAIADLIGRMEAGLHDTGDAGPAAAGDGAAAFTHVLFDSGGVVAFPRDRVYFGAFGRQPAARRADTGWTRGVNALVEEVQALEARRETEDARVRLASLRRAEPRLGEWAAIVDARIRHRAGDGAQLDRLADPVWADSTALTPSGLPASIAACLVSNSVGSGERRRFLPLLERTRAGLRAGQWWLSADERAFYDRELARMIEAAGGPQRSDADARLERLRETERMARQSPPYRRDQTTRSYDRTATGSFLAIWAPTPQTSDAWAGVVVPREALARALESSLAPLFAGEPFGSTLRDGRGDRIWGIGNGRDPGGWHVQPVRAISGFELAFSTPAALAWTEDRRLLWYAFISLLVAVLLFGVHTTTQHVRHEIEFARLRSEFLGAVTHEFKSPITGIRLLIERVSSGRVQSAEDMLGYQSAIARETERLERLVNRLLEAQQIESGHRQYQFLPISPRDVVSEAVAYLGPQADARRIRLHTEVDDPLPDTVHLDRGAVTEALENLIDNAIKYSPSDTTIIVRAGVADGVLRIDVIDQGVGIEPADRLRIFERFYRARRGDQQSVRGTGLGLALVKAAVEAHGGRVTVASVPGRGATFSIVIPVMTDPGPTPDAAG